MRVNRGLIVERQKICWLVRLGVDALNLRLVGFEVVCWLVPLFVAHFIVTTHLGISKNNLGLIQSRKATLFRGAKHVFETTR